MMRGKKLWNLLRIVLLFMIRRKGTLMSKRKQLIIMDMNLMMKSGKLLGKTLGNLIIMFHHHSRSTSASAGGFGIGHYEFSCTNTPNHVPIFHVAKRRKQQYYHYFIPCINPPPDHDYDDDLEQQVIPPHIEETKQQQQEQQPNISRVVAVVPNNKIKYYSPNKYSYNDDYSRFGTPDLAPGSETLSPLVVSPFSISVSNYSSEDDDNDEDEDEDDVNENEDIAGDNSSQQVDAAAEDFIRRFYEQLRVQSTATGIQQNVTLI
ncbi:Protein of unknown function DUF761 [Macleaya cordata]|uniref:Uncharacterized protein n=1 Tax=Macleaya cordata TaxID=56857 RepID=A0A200R3P2_MACCD|nr:Protein of unknown function DUF761 [Macleaya cordata]